MAKTKKASAAATATKPSTKKATVTVGASLADAFAQSAAFFGKKATYVAPEEPVTEPTEDAESKPAQDASETAVTQGDEKKPKKKKKDKKRKLEETQNAETVGEGEETPVANDASDEPAATTAIAPEGSVAAALGRDSDKSERTIFVGNVSLDATPNALKTFFSTCGKVESVRLRFLPVAGTAVSDHGNQKLVMKVCATQKIFTDKRDFCHAYVTFATKEGVEKALLKNRSLFLNKTLRIDHENPVVDPQRSVFVGNLSFQITDEAVWAWFDKQLKTDEEPFPVENVRVIRDRETGAGKGFGYVLLKGKMLAAKALALAGKKLQNRELRVQVCGKRTKNKKGEDVAALKHEGRRASGAAGRVLAKKKARGEIVPPAKKAKVAGADATKKPAFGGKKSSAPGGKKPIGAKGGKKPLGKGGKKDAKPRKVSGLAPGVKPKKPKHAARKARQAAEAAAAAKAKK